MSVEIVSPANGKAFKTVQLSNSQNALEAVERSHVAFKTWKTTSLAERKAILTKFIDNFVANKEDIAIELTWLIGRPRKQNLNEVRGFEERGRHLIEIAESSLQDHVPNAKPGFRRFVKREPLGVVFVIAAWNYPYLISVNSVVPALLAGNTVILKQAPQTFPCADQFLRAFQGTGLPENVFQVLHIDHQVAEKLIRNPLVSHVQFTGSVAGGSQVNKIAADRFVTVGLELGGNDAAYVRQDADAANAAENLVDGAFYNSGQSCCGIQRVYVHHSLYDSFVESAVTISKGYVLGDPFDDKVSLGPVINAASAASIRKAIASSVSKGAKPLIDENLFPFSKKDSAYIAPQILVDVTPNMEIVSEEVFGPVFCVIKVSSDKEAIDLINNSKYGLTASIWTKDEVAALSIGEQLETGTVFLNRCDYLDPALPWVGVKDSGRGCSLSKYGFDALTRPKSFHLRLAS